MTAEKAAKIAEKTRKKEMRKDDNANRLISEYAEENKTLHGTVKELAESCRDWATKYADLCKLVIQQHDINELPRDIPERAEGSELKLQVISTPEYAYYEPIYPGKEPIMVILSWRTQATIYDIPDMPTEMMMQFEDDLKAVMRKYVEKTRADNE